MKRIKTKSTFSLIVFLLSLMVNIYSLNNNHQLEKMAGMAEEYFYLGWIFARTGTFYDDETIPPVFRPPGYIFFIGSVLKIWGGVPQKNTELLTQKEIRTKLKSAYHAVYLAQVLLLSLSAAILFLWLSNILPSGYALILAFLFGTNPYMVMLSGLLHYDILHTFLTILSGYILSIGVSSSARSQIALILAGVLWGITTLVRPMTLILPFFVLIMVVIRLNFQWKSTIKMFILFCFGMILAISPYTYRNYKLTHKFIPVNAQGNKMLWAASAKKMNRDPNHYKWLNLWYTGGMKIYRKVTHHDEYKYHIYVMNVLELEKEFIKQAKQNFRNRPDIFFHNFLQNFLTFNLDINSVFIKFFQVIQIPNMRIDKEWFQTGNPQTFYNDNAANAFEAFIRILSLLSILGVILAVRGKDTSLIAPALIYLCYCLAHSIIYMDLMYYYIKIPFLFIFTGFFIKNTLSSHIPIPFSDKNISIAAIFSSFLIGYGLLLTLWIIG